MLELRFASSTVPMLWEMQGCPYWEVTCTLIAENTSQVARQVCGLTELLLCISGGRKTSK